MMNLLTVLAGVVSIFAVFLIAANAFWSRFYRDSFGYSILDVFDDEDSDAIC